VATEILTETTHGDIAQMIAGRAERGWDLHLAKRQLITKTGEDLYTVPSCTGRGTYTVRYGSETESCECADYGVHQGRIACKHLTAVALLYASRRQGIVRRLSDEERLSRLEERLRHERMDDEERMELRDEILKLRG